MLNTAALRFDPAATPLAWAEVSLGVRVVRGPHWRKRWKDDVDKSAAGPVKPRVAGTIVGYVTDDGRVRGRNTNHQFDTDRLGAEPRWVAVAWDTGRESVYPVGFQGVCSLSPAA